MITQPFSVEVVRATIHSLPMAALLIDARGDIVATNSLAQSLFGHEADKLSGRSATEFLRSVPQGGDFANVLSTVTPEAPLTLGSGPGFQVTCEDGSTRTVNIGLQHVATVQGPIFLCAIVDVSGQRRVQAELRDSHERFRHVIASALDAVITMDSEGRITGWNPQARQLFGWTAEEVVGQILADRIVPERFRGQHQTGLRVYLETGVGPALNRRLKLSALRRNGTEFPIELTISPLQIGPVIEFSAFVRDLSEQEKLERARQESEEQLRSMFHLASIGMVRVDLQTHRYIEVNQRFAKLTGYSVAELKTMTPSDLTHPDDRQKDEQLLWAAVRQEIPEYFNVKRYVRKDGQIIWVEINGTLVCDAAGRPIGSIAIVLEVTERKRAESALRASEERLKQAVKVANFGIFEHDHKTNEIHFSQRMRQIWEWPSNEEITIANILKHLLPEDRDQIAEAIQKAHDPRGSGMYDVEHRLLLPNGNTRWLRLRAQTFFENATSDRHPVRTIGACLDITVEKQREEELQALAAQLEQNVESRTIALTKANEELKQAHLALEKTAARLAMPARNRDLERRQYSVEDFSLVDMMNCGAVIRSLSSLSSKPQFTNALVRYLFEHLVDRNGRRAFALVRLFETRPYRQLRSDVRTLARELDPEIESNTPCLQLLATAGDSPEWNDARKSAEHRVIPLSKAVIQKKPLLILHILHQLGFDEVSGDNTPVVSANSTATETENTDTRYFHVVEAMGHPAIPDQEQFIIPHDIHSIIGFGERMPDGRMFVVSMFSHVPIEASTAALIGHLSLSTHLALLSHIHVPEKIEAQILSLDRLLASHEHIVAETEGHLHQTLAQLGASNAELEQFAYVASHDLQEPLRKIQAFADLLSTSHSDQLDEEGLDYLTRMIRATERMRRLINDLLTLSRVTRKGLPFTPTNLNDIVATVLVDLEPRLTASGGAVNVGSLPTIDADPTQMGQLFQNLLSNGLKYARPDVPPQVQITATKTRPPEHVDRHIASRWWKITVSDNGIGFNPAHAEHIFQPFQRLHGRGSYEGTGIGLTICRRIVDRHRGIIKAEGVPGQGAVFTVILPETRSNGE